MPLPLCSCGVIPVAASLRQHGASRSATTAFLLSTPQTGVDSILVSPDSTEIRVGGSTTFAAATFAADGSPLTGAEIQIPAKTVVKFSVAKSLKDLI